MADEKSNKKTKRVPTDPDDALDEQELSSDHDELTEEENDELAEEESDALTVTVSAVNRVTFGEVILHFPERDVNLLLDGPTAARVLAAFAEPWRRRYLQDRIDIESSPMTNLWSSFNLDRLLGVSWVPGIHTRSDERMTVDPPLPVTT